jgi:uncharacterized protein with beta-barrel porin domain
MTRVGWGNICGKLWPASQISASKQRTGYPASTAGGYPVGPRGPDICVGVLARYPTQKDSQISDTKTRPDIRQLHAGRYPSTARRQISVRYAQADIRQLHAGRYPSAAHSQISVSCTQPDIRQLHTAGYLGTGWGQISGLASGPDSSRHQPDIWLMWG